MPLVESAAMLAFERQLVAALTTAPDPGVRAGVERFVDGSLRDMPEVLRLGVLGESVVFSVLATIGRRDPRAVVNLLDHSPVALLRQYVRLFRSLVLFAELELSDVAT